MASNNGGPWGGGPRGTGGGDDDGRRPGGRRPTGDGGAQVPDIDEIVRKGQEQLRVLMGGRGGRQTPPSGGGGGPRMTRGTVLASAAALAGLWVFASLYTVQPEEQGVELFLGEFRRVTDNGLHLAPWPFVTAEVIPVTTERNEDIGVGRSSGQGDDGLMLTTDANIVDIDFQVVWNINDPAKYLFNLRDPQQTVRAVSESAMREVIAQSELAPILNRDRALIAETVQTLIQDTLNSYDSGVNIVRVNLDKADPPREVIDSFRAVQAAEQERDRLQRQADAYANRVLAGARGEAAQILEEAEGYRARVVNEAEGEASRFGAVLEEYAKAPEVTRKRLYLETMEEVLGRVDKIILDDGAGGGQGVVPYLPLNELRRDAGRGTGNTGAAANGGTN
ncbi:MAG: FtsH protease activity modulator HflK [Tranquillimonas sp.]